MLLVESLFLSILLTCVKETQPQSEWANSPAFLFYLKTYSLVTRVKDWFSL